MMRDRRAWIAMTIVAALALAASLNSITNGFVMDDVHLIAESARMHSLAGWWREFGHTYWPERWGGDGYRPLTIIAFRFEWAAGGGTPLVFHIVNVVLHVAGALAVWWLAVAILPIGAATIAAALYAVHPVHVEAIANVVGQSELWVVLLISLAVALYVHARRAGTVSPARWAAIGAVYSVAMLFKEHAIVLPAILIAAEATVVRDRASWRQRFVTLRLPILVLGLLAAGYLWARSTVVVSGLAGFVPYIVFQALDLSATNRVLTMIGAVPEWVRLFIWPARLMTDYAPPYIDIAQGPSIAQLPGLLMLIGALGLIVACWKRSAATSFGLLWMVMALLPASNFIVPAGFIIAERTLVLPSVGVVIALASVVPALYEQVERSTSARRALSALLLGVLALGIARSVTRNRAWESNDVLFHHGVLDAPLSYRAHVLLGVHLFEQKRKVEGEVHYRHAMQLFPYDPMMVYDMAEKYRGAGMCEPANTLYRWLYSIRPDFDLGRMGYASCLLETLQLDDARREALRAIRAGGRLMDARAIIRTAAAVRDTIAARRARGEKTPIIAPSGTAKP